MLLHVLCSVLLCYTLLLVFFLVFTWNSGTFRRNLLTWASLQAVEYYNIVEIYLFHPESMEYWSDITILWGYFFFTSTTGLWETSRNHRAPLAAVSPHCQSDRGVKSYWKTRNPNILPSTTAWLHLPWNPVCWDEILCMCSLSSSFPSFQNKSLSRFHLNLLRFSSSAREKWSGVGDWVIPP